MSSAFSITEDEHVSITFLKELGKLLCLVVLIGDVLLELGRHKDDVVEVSQILRRFYTTSHFIWHIKFHLVAKFLLNLLKYQRMCLDGRPVIDQYESLCRSVFFDQTVCRNCLS